MLADKRALFRADASQHEWFVCNDIGIHTVSRAPLNKALDRDTLSDDT